MAPPKYRLEALIRIKTRAKKRAEIALARAIIRLKKERDHLKKLEEEKKRIIERWKETRIGMASKMGVGAFIGEGNVHMNYLRKLKEDEEEKEEEIVSQKEIIEECELNVAKARRDYIDAAKELQVIEKHKELWQKKIKHELNQKESREMDELGSTIHQLKKWKGEKSAFES